jgi:hypothetical protein
MSAARGESRVYEENRTVVPGSADASINNNV